MDAYLSKGGSQQLDSAIQLFLERATSITFFRLYLSCYEDPAVGDAVVSRLVDVLKDLDVQIRQRIGFEIIRTDVDFVMEIV